MWYSFRSIWFSFFIFKTQTIRLLCMILTLWRKERGVWGWTSSIMPFYINTKLLTLKHDSSWRPWCRMLKRANFEDGWLDWWICPDRTTYYNISAVISRTLQERCADIRKPLYVSLGDDSKFKSYSRHLLAHLVCGRRACYEISCGWRRIFHSPRSSQLWWPDVLCWYNVSQCVAAKPTTFLTWEITLLFSVPAKKEEKKKGCVSLSHLSEWRTARTHAKTFCVC